MDHSNMNHHMPDSMAEMPMTFFNSINTPLYTIAWKPTTAAQYAFTCLFLVLLCIVFRGLLAARCNLTSLLSRPRTNKIATEEMSCCAAEEGGDFVEKYLRDGAALEHARHGSTGASRRKVAEVLLRAVMDTSLALVSYLLMLAVMTMNSGYFLAVLVGTFAGSVLLGGYTGAAGH